MTKKTLIHSANQLLTLGSKVQRGLDLGDLFIIPGGGILIEGDKIIEIGDSVELLKKYPDSQQINASGKVILPGFVDSHTHVIWAGDRSLEFELKLEGKSYIEILNSGGGILSTVKATRDASLSELVDQTRPRLEKMFNHGATTIEAKTGYGLDIDTEIKLLEGLLILDNEGPWDLCITFLGAHAVPGEYKGDSEGYTNYVCLKMIPEVKKWWENKVPNRPLPFVDVFCETGAFDLEQSEKILKTALDFDFPIKIHADEFDNLGGTELAVSIGAVSSDHLIAVSEKDLTALGKADTIAVTLPGTPFGLAESKYAPAKSILESGASLAIASDLNPGTSWCENIQMAISLACRFMELTPAQAIAATTINGAAAVGKADEIGSLQRGKKADLLILDIPDYRHLGYRYGTNLVETVVKNGIVHNI